MDARERFQKTMKFKECDRPIICEFMGFWQETINRWYSEGLPYYVSNPTLSTRITLVGGGTTTKDIFEYLGLDGINTFINDIGIDYGPIPRRVRKVITEDERYRIEIDELGITLKAFKEGVSMPGWIDFPVKNEDDFEKMKNRFDPKDPRRLPKYWSEEAIEELNSRDVPVSILMPGLFWQARLFLGLERLVTKMYLEPRFIGEILDFWVDFLINVTKPIVREIKIDYIHLAEDISGKNGPLISPNLFRKFLLPRYKKLTDFLKSNNVEVIAVDSDGDLRKLIPLYLEAGFNCILPLEAAAYMDVCEIREKYGKNLLMIGNIDKTALIKGPKFIKEEVKRKATVALEGGYIMSVDHQVPYDVPFQNYIYYLRTLREQLKISAA